MTRALLSALTLWMPFAIVLSVLPSLTEAIAASKIDLAERNQAMEKALRRTSESKDDSIKKQPITWDISGYHKSIAFITRTTGESPDSAAVRRLKTSGGDVVTFFQDRLRMNLKVNYDRFLTAMVAYDNELNTGDFVNSGEDRLTQVIEENSQFLDVSDFLARANYFRYRHRLYRAFLDVQNHVFKLRIGRQQIPWGVGHFFTPTDVFNPFKATQLETEERQGVDGISLDTSVLKPIANVEFVFTPRHRGHAQRYAVKVKRNVLGYDTSVLGGFKNEDEFVGLDLRGNLKGAALRAEGIAVNASGEDNYLQFTVNADYNFPHNIYGLLEYHFNGRGRAERGNYERSRALTGEILNLGKNYLGATVGKDVTSLLRTEVAAIYNVNDTSFVFIPEVKYQIRENWNWLTKMFAFVGEGSSEFGSSEHLYYTELQVFF